jgi:hypothetical protein
MIHRLILWCPKVLVNHISEHTNNQEKFKAMLPRDGASTVVDCLARHPGGIALYVGRWWRICSNSTVVEVDDVDEILVVASSGCVRSNDSLTTWKCGMQEGHYTTVHVVILTIQQPYNSRCLRNNCQVSPTFGAHGQRGTLSLLHCTHICLLLLARNTLISL